MGEMNNEEEEENPRRWEKEREEGLIIKLKIQRLYYKI